MKSFKILAINPGSDSVKIALYEDYNLIFQETVKNSMSELLSNQNLNSTIPEKTQKILEVLKKIIFHYLQSMPFVVELVV